MEGLIALAVLLVIVLIVLVNCIKIVPQAHAMVIERLGGYLTTWSVGLHLKVPFIDRIAKRVILKEQVVDFPPQPVITKDNVTMQIDTVVYFQITDPKLYAYGVENPIMAIENLTATTLRNIIGDLELDETLTSRETINTKMRATLDVATDPWGIKVNRVELKNIIPPKAIQDAMEKQMKAERERREAILRAEGEKKSTILVAEGNKESVILDAEAEKQAAILRAEAKKEATIQEAAGQAEAILKIQQANADGLRMLKEANPDNAVLQIKSLEAFAKAADGKAMEKYEKELEDDIGYWCFIQYEFYKQWDSLKKYANSQGIEIIGDIPIYMGYDSVDVWAVLGIKFFHYFFKMCIKVLVSSCNYDKLNLLFLQNKAFIKF